MKNVVLIDKMTGVIPNKYEAVRVIAKEAEEGQYSLILMGARGLSPLKQLILGSVSKDVLYHVTQSIVGIVYP